MIPSEHDADTTTVDETIDCASLELATGAVVIYHPDNHRAWLQSDASVTVQDRR